MSRRTVNKTTESYEDLAAHLRAVLRHPLCPDELYESIMTFINDTSSELGDELWLIPRVMEAALKIGQRTLDERLEMPLRKRESLASGAVN